jgi:hypothetical protein
MISDALKVPEFYKDDLPELFADERLHLRGLLLNLENSPTRVLEMSDVVEARR